MAARSAERHDADRKRQKTTLSLRGGPVNATDEERAIFVGNIDSMRQGFGGTFDKLTDWLGRAKS